MSLRFSPCRIAEYHLNHYESSHKAFTQGLQLNGETRQKACGQHRYMTASDLALNHGYKIGGNMLSITPSSGQSVQLSRVRSRPYWPDVELPVGSSVQQHGLLKEPHQCKLKCNPTLPCWFQALLSTAVNIKSMISCLIHNCKYGRKW